MRKRERTEQAARAFFNRLLPQESWDYSAHPAKALVLAAFHLYAREWAPLDVRSWEWPFDELRLVLSGGGALAFTGDQPWTVLLRRAVELAHA
jgi:hypothetical protein